MNAIRNRTHSLRLRGKIPRGLALPGLVPARLASSGLARGAALALAALALASPFGLASASAQGESVEYSDHEIARAADAFFGRASGATAELVERIFSEHGAPNGYVLGRESGGAFIFGLRYGKGVLHTRNAGERTVYWQGPSAGLDWGIDASRTMMLVYDLPSAEAIFRRYVGIEGSAFAVGGLAVTLMSNAEVKLIPIRAGVGGRFGVNLGYLKFTPDSDVNPF